MDDALSVFLPSRFSVNSLFVGFVLRRLPGFRKSDSWDVVLGSGIAVPVYWNSCLGNQSPLLYRFYANHDI